MQKVDVFIDPECDAAFPGARSARVAITLNDGRVLSHFQPTRKGDPEMPLSDAELEAKFFELSEPAIGTQAARGLLARLWRIDSTDDVGLVPQALAQAPEGQAA